MLRFYLLPYGQYIIYLFSYFITRVFGDGKTYFFIRWADKTKNKGCTNFICMGFVQVEPHFHLGKLVAQTSIYNGKQFELLVNISL
ncbi:hypothetical protein Lal_00027865, partial [Lupinus albus]